MHNIDNIWPIDFGASSEPAGWTGWPDGKQFAFVITHDVDTQKGHDQCLQLAEMEEKLGFRSSFNFVIQDYNVSPCLRHELVKRGFEVGIHGLTHNASMYKSEREFTRQALCIQRVLKEWGAVGFRSPCMYRNLEWLTFLDIEYDASTFDTDPFEPQPEGVRTIFPFLVQSSDAKKSYVELPYTLPQDFTLFILLKQKNIDIWMQKLDWLVKQGGMALINVHPDYLNFQGKSGFEEYPVDFYRNFLLYILEKYKGMYWNALPKEIAAFWKLNDTKKPFCQNIISDKPLTYRFNPAPQQLLHICHLAYTFYEGDNRVIRYADMMHEQGNDVEVVALREKGQKKCTERNGIRVFHLQYRIINEKHLLSYLFKLLFFFIRSTIFISLQHLRRPYHVLHVHNMPDFLIFAAWLPKLTGAKIILDIHDILPELFADKFSGNRNSFLFRLLVLVERLSCAFADHVIIANDIWRDRLISRSVSEKKCTTLMNYPNLKLFKPLPESKKRNDGKFTMIYPGSLNYHQGLDVAIKALDRIKDELPFIEFFIYGSGPAKKELISLAQEMNLSDRIFFQPSLPIEEIAKIIAHADLGIIPKRAEGFGNEAFSTKTLEFMACGVPIIVSDTQIDRYYFNDSIAVFFKSGDEEALAEALRHTVKNEEKRHRLAQNALRFVSKKSWEKHKSLYGRILELLLFDLSRSKPH